MSYDSFRLKLVVHQSAENGTKWRIWEKNLTVYFAPTKGLGFTIGGYFSPTKREDAKPLYGSHTFGLASDSELTWMEDPQWFRLTEKVHTGHGANPVWLYANGFDEVKP